MILDIFQNNKKNHTVDSFATVLTDMNYRPHKTFTGT